MKSQKKLMGLALISDLLISVEPEGFFARTGQAQPAQEKSSNRRPNIV
ncbi:MAG: hypothetical protein JWR09_4756 [Mucilaginibacter sp.]|nr:hypothetical protein [Mucilaginibacter sp.]